MAQINFLTLIIGSCIGSFLNVVIYRLPKQKSIIFNRSQCNSCKTKLNILDLFPIISWLFLLGRCRYCGTSVSVRYPFVEFITSFLFFLSMQKGLGIDDFSSSLFLVISGWILISYLVILFFIDIDEMILPNSITNSGTLVGLFLIFYFDFFINNTADKILLDHLYAYILAFFGISIFSYLIKLIIKKPVLGGGDVKLFAMSGLWLGLEGLEVTITLSFLISAIFVLFGLIIRSIKRGSYIAFGPFICISFLLVWFFGPQFWFESLGNIFWWKYL